MRLLQKLIDRQPHTDTTHTLSNPDKHRWHSEVDVLVAGFGGAGAAAALEAHEQGQQVLVLDRFQGGGATTISGGIYYAGGGTDIQKQAGVEDTPENMFNYLKHETRGVISDETLKDFCDSSVENFDWIRKHGVPFQASYCPFKTSYPPDHFFYYYSGNESFPPYSDDASPAARGHRGHRKGISGAAIYEPMRESAEKAGIAITTQSKVTGLFTNTDGEVIGVKALELEPSSFWGRLHRMLFKFQTLMRYSALYFPPLFPLLAWLSELIELNHGEEKHYRARKGVVLATGGFFVNQAMVKQYAPDYVGGSPLGTMSDDGSGIKLGEQLGAGTAEMDNVSAWRFINPPQGFARGMLAGPSGQRICNEMLYGAQVGDQMMKHHDGKAYVIIDSKIREQAIKDLNLKQALWFHVLLGYFYLYLDSKKADSVHDLAIKLGMPPQQLEQSIADYNALASSDDKDPMGKPKEFVNAIEQGPFYAINASYDSFFVPCPSLTLGGLVVDEKSGLVCKQDGDTIKGLYAVGRTAVGIASAGYVSGLSIADCVYSGRRAARHAAQQ